MSHVIFNWFPKPITSLLHRLLLLRSFMEDRSRWTDEDFWPFINMKASSPRNQFYDNKESQQRTVRTEKSLSRSRNYEHCIKRTVSLSSTKEPCTASYPEQYKFCPHSFISFLFNTHPKLVIFIARWNKHQRLAPSSSRFPRVKWVCNSLPKWMIWAQIRFWDIPLLEIEARSWIPQEAATLIEVSCP
jgi:hypothetical protein